ncbi:MAG TPA: hypothetical protein VGP80_00825 [Gemmatimonadales bacterium]|jgi:hypothetical protein|nr:hypothetical protein [Gemmatimonadales bacterium]
MKRLRDIDSAELAHRLRVFVWLGCSVFIILGAVELRVYGFGLKFLFLLFLNIPILALLGSLLLWVVHHAARGWVDTVSGAGNIAPAASFSFQESLIIRGLYAEAAESYRGHIAANPGDNDARLALAKICSAHLNDPTGAERLYQAVQRNQPTARQEATAANQLIDLYRATGEVGRLKMELARYAERYAGTRAGVEAKRMLMALKEESRE